MIDENGPPFGDGARPHGDSGGEGRERGEGEGGRGATTPYLHIGVATERERGYWRGRCLVHR